MFLKKEGIQAITGTTPARSGRATERRARAS